MGLIDPVNERLKFSQAAFLGFNKPSLSSPTLLLVDECLDGFRLDIERIGGGVGICI
jgi:hypothetical protein